MNEPDTMMRDAIANTESKPIDDPAVVLAGSQVGFAEVTIITSVMSADSRTKTMRLFCESGQALVLIRQVIAPSGIN